MPKFSLTNTVKRKSYQSSDLNVMCFFLFESTRDFVVNNLLIDATFFGREYGFLVFHDCQKVIYFKEVKTESVKDFREGIIALKAANYCILSVTIDGRRGYINNIRKLLGRIPIQMCLFHQKANYFKM